MGSSGSRPPLAHIGARCWWRGGKLGPVAAVHASRDDMHLAWARSCRPTAASARCLSPRLQDCGQRDCGVGCPGCPHACASASCTQQAWPTVVGMEHACTGPAVLPPLHRGGRDPAPRPFAPAATVASASGLSSATQYGRPIAAFPSTVCLPCALPCACKPQCAPACHPPSQPACGANWVTPRARRPPSAARATGTAGASGATMQGRL